MPARPAAILLVAIGLAATEPTTARAVDPAISAALAALYQVGFPDVRDLRYAAVTVLEATDPGDAIHGWLSKDDPTRVIGWDGWPHVVIAVIDDADLIADAVRLTAITEYRSSTTLRGGASGRVHAECPDAVSWALAAQIGDVPAWWTPPSDRIAPDVARAWLLAGWDDALASHAAGRAANAAVRGEQVLTALRATRALWPDDDPGAVREADVGALVADDLRRAAVHAGAPAWTVDRDPAPSRGGALRQRDDLVAVVPDAKARAQLLIDALEDVASQRGTFGIWDDPAVVLLAAEGDDAVPALINALAVDRRLTRCVRSDDWHGMAPDDVIPVAEFLETELARRARGDVPLPAGDPAARAAIYSRRLADKSRLAGPENDLARLADHTLDHQRRAGAAWSLTQRVDGGADAPLRGEPLRSRGGISVTDVMRGALGDALAADEDPCLRVGRAAATIAGALCRWDPAAARDPAAAAWATLAARGAGSIARDGDGYLADALAELAEARADAGDERALSDYAAWLAGTDVWGGQRRFALAQRKPLAPDIGAAVVAAFSAMDRAAATHPPYAAGLPPYADTMDLGRIIVSPLIAAPEPRAWLLDRLADRAASGTTSIGYWEASARGVGVGPYACRVCDRWGERIAELPGMPALRPWWDEDRRDAALAIARERLARYGARYRARWATGIGMTLSVAPTPPAATATDVAAGRAIVAAPADAVAARTLPLASGAAARWRGHRGDGIAMLGDHATVVDDDLGWIGHVEAWRDTTGGEHRVVGFVGAHDLAAAPAEEVELEPEDGSSAALADGWHARLALADGGAWPREGPPPTLADTAPITLAFALRNARLVDRNAPATAFPAGTTLEVRWRARPYPDATIWDDVGWEPVATIALDAVAVSREHVAATASVQRVVDLGDIAACARAGTYAVRLRSGGRAAWMGWRVILRP